MKENKSDISRRAVLKSTAAGTALSGLLTTSATASSNGDKFTFGELGIEATVAPIGEIPRNLLYTEVDEPKFHQIGPDSNTMTLESWLPERIHKVMRAAQGVIFSGRYEQASLSIGISRDRIPTRVSPDGLRTTQELQLTGTPPTVRRIQAKTEGENFEISFGNSSLKVNPGEEIRHDLPAFESTAVVPRTLDELVEVQDIPERKRARKQVEEEYTVEISPRIVARNYGHVELGSE